MYCTGEGDLRALNIFACLLRTRRRILQVEAL
jgi:hypothetical protein